MLTSIIIVIIFYISSLLQKPALYILVVNVKFVLSRCVLLIATLIRSFPDFVILLFNMCLKKTDLPPTVLNSWQNDEESFGLLNVTNLTLCQIHREEFFPPPLF